MWRNLSPNRIHDSGPADKQLRMRCMRYDLRKLEHGMGSKLPANRRSRESAGIGLKVVMVETADA